MPRKKATGKDEILKVLEEDYTFDEEKLKEFELNFHKFLLPKTEESPVAKGSGKNPSRTTFPAKIDLAKEDIDMDFRIDLQRYLDSFGERIRASKAEEHEYLMVDALSKMSEKIKEEKEKNHRMELEIAKLTAEVAKLATSTTSTTSTTSNAPNAPTTPNNSKISNKLARIRTALKKGKLTPESIAFIKQECKTETVQRNMISAFKAYCELKKIEIQENITFDASIQMMESIKL